ncbi:MAG TPA: VanZ family protein [Acidobacteriota bacterium]|nr:VanZ family protein [Acidobacteriota bacterium]
MALFLEVFWLSHIDCIPVGLDHVSVPDEMTFRRSFLFYWVPVIIYSILILSLSSLSKVPGAERLPDKFLHVLEYGIYAYLLWHAVTLGGELSLTWKRGGIILGAGSAFGALDEFYQSFVPGRFSSIGDWYADVAGILGIVTLILVKNKSGGPQTG